MNQDRTELVLEWIWRESGFWMCFLFSPETEISKRFQPIREQHIHLKCALRLCQQNPQMAENETWSISKKKIPQRNICVIVGVFVVRYLKICLGFGPGTFAFGLVLSSLPVCECFHEPSQIGPFLGITSWTCRWSHQHLPTNFITVCFSQWNDG